MYYVSILEQVEHNIDNQYEIQYHIWQNYISLRCNPPKNGSKLLYKFGKKKLKPKKALSRDPVIGF